MSEENPGDGSQPGRSILETIDLSTLPPELRQDAENLTNLTQEIKKLYEETKALTAVPPELPISFILESSTTPGTSTEADTSTAPDSPTGVEASTAPDTSTAPETSTGTESSTGTGTSTGPESSTDPEASTATESSTTRSSESTDLFARPKLVKVVIKKKPKLSRKRFKKLSKLTLPSCSAQAESTESTSTEGSTTPSSDSSSYQTAMLTSPSSSTADPRKREVSGDGAPVQGRRSSYLMIPAFDTSEGERSLASSEASLPTILLPPTSTPETQMQRMRELASDSELPASSVSSSELFHSTGPSSDAESAESADSDKSKKAKPLKKVRVLSPSSARSSLSEEEMISAVESVSAFAPGPVQAEESSGDVAPGTSEDVAPGISEDVAPGTSEDVAPGTSEDVAPGTSEVVAPGISEDVAPGTSEEVASGTSGDVAPRTSETEGDGKTTTEPDQGDS